MSTDETASIFDDETFILNHRPFAPADKRVIGGEITTDFPECVAVLGDNGFCCTGTLITPQAVLTAGHCVARGCSTQIFIGGQVGARGTTIRVQEPIPHPRYIPDSIENPFDDLAILVLAESVRTVAPARVCSMAAIASATSVMVVGFGNTDAAALTGSGTKRKVEVGLASESPNYGARYETEFVAGAPNIDRDSCTGDSGGPAYVLVDGEFQLAGATSRATRQSSRPCGDGGVYSRVPAYREWIESTIGPLD